MTDQRDRGGDSGTPADRTPERERFRRLQERFEQIEAAEPFRREALLEEIRVSDPDLFPELAELVEDLDAEPRVGLEVLAADAADLVAEAGEGGVRSGQSIDRYRLKRRIGVGGMGEVWLAEQHEPVQREVALKVLRRAVGAGRAQIARFEAERQALATMDHPHIARVFDGGATDTGQPYFVMELVADAQPITEYCAQQALGLEERLDLFLPVCEAVEHAHRKRIIHRDLKPSNVLVTEVNGRPVAKVIDFGIAKPLEEEWARASHATMIGELVGTPEYMSPEQASLGAVDVDTRSDVFTLGLLLFELVVGDLPISSRALRKLPFDEVCRRIREDDTPRASTLLRKAGTTRRDHRDPVPPTSAPPSTWRRVQGDLDRILAKALAKERNQRYGSAIELADDLRRFLAHEPVRATPPSRRYRMAKFVRRHRVAVSAAVFLVLGLVVGLAVALVGFDRARRAEAEALATLASLRSSEQFLVDLFREASPENNPGDDVTASELLRRGIEQLETLDDQPRVQGRLLWNLGQVQNVRGAYDEAEELLRRAIELLEGENRDPEELVSAQLRLASVLRRQQRLSESEELVRRALGVTRSRLSGATNREELEGEALNLLAMALRGQGRHEEAAETYAELVPLRRRTDDGSSNTLPVTLFNAAVNLWSGGDTRAALAALDEPMSLFVERLPAKHPNLATLHHTIGTWSEEVGALLCAAQHEQRAIEIYREVLPPNHSHLGDALNGLGISRLALGEVDAARTAFEEADRIYTAAHGADSWRRMAALGHLGDVALFDGDAPGAAEIYRRKIEVLRAEPDSPNNRRNLSATLRLLAVALRSEANARSVSPPAEVDDVLDEAAELLEGLDRPAEAALVDLVRATIAAQRRDRQSAEQLLRRAEAAVGAPSALDQPRAFVFRAQVPALLAEPDGAAELIRQAIDGNGVAAWLRRDPVASNVWSGPSGSRLAVRLTERLSEVQGCVDLSD